MKPRAAGEAAAAARNTEPPITDAGPALFRLVRFWSRRWIMRTAAEITGEMRHVQHILAVEAVDIVRAHSDEATVATIAYQLGLDHSGASRMVRDATTADYLTRARDRRRTVLTLTPRARHYSPAPANGNATPSTSSPPAGPTTTAASSPPTSTASPASSTWAKEDRFTPRPAETPRAPASSKSPRPSRCRPTAAAPSRVAASLGVWLASPRPGHRSSGHHLRPCLPNLHRRARTGLGGGGSQRTDGMETRVSHSSRAGVSRGCALPRCA
jgi:hypothetical protein